MSRSAPLYALQQIDSEIDARKQRLAEINELIRETGELIAARERLVQVRDELVDLRVQQRDQELLLQSVLQKKAKSEQRMYGGKVRNPKELTDLHDEVTSLSRRQSGMEDDLLETMLQIEASEEEEREATEHLARIEAQWKSSQSNLQAEFELQERRLAELRSMRAEMIKPIVAPDLASYDYLRIRKGGQAIALLEGAECQGCMTTVPSSRAKEARSGAIAYCGTCGRILHVG